MSSIPAISGFPGEQLPVRNKLAWIDELFGELSRDEAVQELLQRLRGRVQRDMDAVLSLSEIVNDFTGV